MCYIIVRAKKDSPSAGVRRMRFSFFLFLFLRRVGHRRERSLTACPFVDCVSILSGTMMVSGEYFFVTAVFFFSYRLHYFRKPSLIFSRSLPIVAVGPNFRVWRFPVTPGLSFSFPCGVLKRNDQDILLQRLDVSQGNSVRFVRRTY